MHIDQTENLITINTIKGGGSTAQYAAYTVDTVYTVATVDMVYTVDIVYTVYTVFTIQTALQC